MSRLACGVLPMPPRLRGSHLTPPMLPARRLALLLSGVLLSGFGLSIAGPVWAVGEEQPLRRPSGAVVLSIGGALRHSNLDGRAAFDMAMLEKLPQVSFRTQTPWYATPRKFTGPLLRDVLAAVGAQGRLVEARAINDYKVSIPLEDAQRYDVIVARLIDDKPMPLRDKGPLFIVYPFDRHVELRNSVYYGRSAWQLKSLELR